MSTSAASHTIDSLDALEALSGPIADLSLRKEVNYLHPVYQAMITAAPFVVLATIGPDGLDMSPRGEPARFVVVQDEHTLLLPERRGHHRKDSLRDIVAHPRVSLLVLIPSVA